MNAAFEWLKDHDTLAWVLGAVSMAMFLGSLIVLPIFIARMPADYFKHDRPPPDSWRGQHPALRMVVLITKNLIGLVLVVAGLAMLVLPGQGIIAILIGLTLLNFPGKRRLELAIVRHPAVSGAIAWIRTRANRPQLELPAGGDSRSSR